LAFEDRRKDPRHPVNLLVHVAARDVGELAERYATDLSRGGLFVRTREPYPVGTPVRLEVRLSDGEPAVRALAVVRYSQPDRPGVEPSARPGMGLEFIELDEPSRHTLEVVCEYARIRNQVPGVPGMFPGPAASAPGAVPLPSSPEVRTGGQAAPQPPVLQPGRVAGPTLTRDSLGLPGLDPGFAPPRTGPVIGIDLGTTHCCVAFVRDGRAAVLPSREGHRTVPSIIALNSRSKLVVGHPAKGQLLTLPEQTVYGSKRLVGRPYRSQVVQVLKDRFFYEIVEGPGGEAAVRLGGTVLTLQETAALILREVRDVAQDTLGQPIHRAVITCPAYYNESQRAAVREAGRLAGLHVERILSEPTAAALAFGYGKGIQKRILVYDLGGGTFDASVLELHDTVFEVVSTGGDTFLGGVDFDARLVDHLLLEFKKATGYDMPPDRVALQRITDAAERAKCALSERQTERIQVPFVAVVDGRPLDLDVTVTRQQLEELTAPLVERTVRVVEQVLAAKHYTRDQIDEILLVGGMSRMPLVRRRLRQYFGREAHRGVHPDEAVALGASLLAHSLDRAEGVVLIDVVPMSLGIGLPGGACRRLIERNSPLPVTRSFGVATTEDFQTSLELPVYQGESDRAADNEFLGTLTVTDLPRAPRGTVRIAVTFHLSAECLLTVTAKELSTGRTARAVMSTKSRTNGEAVRPGTMDEPVDLDEAVEVAAAPPDPGTPGDPLAPTPPARPGHGLLRLFRRLFRSDRRPRGEAS
jgi:molecular chaperone DnaK